MRLARFYLLAFALSWAWWLPLVAEGRVVQAADRRRARNHERLPAGLAAGAVAHADRRRRRRRDRGLTLPGLGGVLVGLASGSLLLAWLYERTGLSSLAISVWHGTFNLCTGSAAARGLPAAVVTTAVIVFAVVLALRELAHPRARASRLEEGKVT
jgi:hypothetical protein